MLKLLAAESCATARAFQLQQTTAHLQQQLLLQSLLLLPKLGRVRASSLHWSLHLSYPLEPQRMT
jgi:hypothetical protein